MEGRNRRRSDAIMLTTEAQQGFLLKLSDALRSLTDAIGIQEKASAILGEQLHVSRAFYFAVEREPTGFVHIVKKDFYCQPGMQSLIGRYAQVEFGERVFENLAIGETLVVADVTKLPTVTSEELQRYLTLEVRSFVAVPLIKDGEYVAGFIVEDLEPREWTRAEIALVEETAERTWAAVRRARTEEALRESEAKLAVDLIVMQRLYDLHSRPANETDLKTALHEILVAACEFTHTSRGCIQLVSHNGESLEMFAWYGYADDNPFIEHFRHQGSKPACDTARQQLRRLIIEDVENFAPLAGTKDREIALAENIRATQSTPMISRSGEMVGVLNTQFDRPHRSSDAELKLIDLLAWMAADFVERYRAYHALRSSEEKARAVVSLVPALLWQFDASGQTITQDRRWLEYTGLTLAESQGDGWQAAIHPDDLPNTVRVFAEAYKTPSALEVEHRVRRHDGVYRWFLVRQMPLKDENGEVLQWFGAAIDIHESRVAMEALRESEDLLQRLIENLPGGAVFVVNRELRYVLAQGEALVQAGFEPADLVGKTIFEALPPDLVESYEPRYRQALAGKPFEHDHEAHGRAFVSRGVPLRDRGGNIYAVLAVSYDITERKRAEEALQASAERWQRAFEVEAVGVIFFNTSGDVTAANDTFLRMSGYSRADLEKGLVRWDVMTPPEFMEQSLAAVAEFKATGRVSTYEKQYIRKDGTRWWALFTGARLSGDEGVEYVLDITERKRMEEALRQSEERFQHVARATRDIVWDIDLVKDRVWWSEALQTQFGFAKEEIGPDMAWCFAHMHPEDRDRVVSGMKRAATGNDSYWGDEFRYQRADGTYANINDRGFIIRDASGKALRMIGAMQDITESKRAEEALRSAYDELEERVRERTSQLSDLNQTLLAEVHDRTAAEERARMLVRQIVTAQEYERTRIARDLHDHFGQQLTALRLKLDRLREQCSDAELFDLAGQAQDIVKELDDGVEFLARELRPSALDDFGLVVALTNFIQQWSRHFNIVTDFHSAGLDKERFAPEIETNLYRIAQEALNNVSKHADASQVDIILERRDHHAVLIIEDDGIGFDPETEAVLDKSSKGLGLTGMQERAVLIGGAVEIQSSPGEGTTVFARVRLSTDEEGNAAS